jgi:3-oxoacyl-[acyl-carrier-protein] synthase-1
LSGPSPQDGSGLIETFRNAFAALDDAGASVGAVIADLNGERPRALEWGHTEGRIFPNTERERVLRHPADTLGDCGGAMGAAILVDAIAGFILHHRAPRQVALTTSDETGARRVICLERGDRLDRRLFMGGLRRQHKMEKQPPLPEEGK